MTQRNKKTFHPHVLEEKILLKRLYYPRQSTDLMQSIPNRAFFTELEQTVPKIIWNQEDPA